MPTNYSNNRFRDLRLRDPVETQSSLAPVPSAGIQRIPVPMSAIRPDDVVIFVMGKTGSGMSNFINKLTRMQPEDGADQLSSCTRTVSAYKCYHKGQRFIFVDTPGFNNQQLSQWEVLREIATWLKETYRKSIELTGVIYTHNIEDSMCAVDEQSFQSFCRLCGNEAADRVRLVTTMWDDVDEPEAAKVEGMLKRTRWQSFIRAGAEPGRFDNTWESAWNIVEGLGITTKTLLLQKELVDMGKALEDTTAGRLLRRGKPATICGRVKGLFGG